MVVIEASNAEFVLDGASMEETSNNFTVNGLTLDLVSTSYNKDSGDYDTVQITVCCFHLLTVLPFLLQSSYCAPLHDPLTQTHTLHSLLHLHGSEKQGLRELLNCMALPTIITTCIQRQKKA